MRFPPAKAACVVVASLAVASSVLLAPSSALAQGIAPPPPMDPNAPGSPGSPGTSTPEDATRQKLDEAEREDSGRGFEIAWLRGELGGSYINMQQLSSNTLQLQQASSGGPMFGVAGGVRLLVFVAGARLRYNALSSFNMWQINAEAGAKLPLGSFDLLFELHGGYSFVGRLGDAALATDTNVPKETDKVNIRGFNGGLDLGLDYYVSPLFSIGAAGFADVLFLNRPPLAKPAGFDKLTAEQQAAINNDPLYAKSGTSAGLGFGGSINMGLHFGL